jgi:hypothetical protein
MVGVALGRETDTAVNLDADAGIGQRAVAGHAGRRGGLEIGVGQTVKIDQPSVKNLRATNLATRSHVRAEMFERLKLTDRLTKLLADLGVFDGDIFRRFGHTEQLRS